MHILKNELARVVQQFKFYTVFVDGGLATHVVLYDGKFLRLKKII